MYKTEPHIHLSEVSACSELNAKEMIKLYYEAGYKTVLITDHFYSIYFNSLGDIPWEDKVTIFFSGFYKVAGDSDNLLRNPFTGFLHTGACTVQKADSYCDGAHVKVVVLYHVVGLDDLMYIYHIA